MARKSRKRSKIENEQPIEISGKLRTAAYCRLSVEDDGSDDENSMTNQIRLVHDYINDNPEMILEETYTDNGFTGTAFNRPGFIKLIEDAKSGRIQCIVVKDLSRFGRDYLETGHYLETIFPRLNVRFIAVNDHFDSSIKSDIQGLSMPIKNLINTMYAKDISKKVSASYTVRKEKGEMFGNCAPYGYSYNEDKSKLLINEETAPYARMIFQWTRLGISRTEIISRLELLGAIPPDQVSGRKLDKRKIKSGWSKGTLSVMLQNQAYCGDVVTGKTLCRKYKGIKSHLTGPEQWTVTPDQHPALVSREDFEIIQERRKKNAEYRMEANANRSKERAENPDELKGMVYCADCGRKMIFVRGPYTETSRKMQRNQYVCKCKASACYGRSVRENLLKTLLMDQIRIQFQLFGETAPLLKEAQSGKTGAMASFRTKVLKAQERKRLAEERKISLYEDYVAGVLAREDYQRLNEHCIMDIQKAETQFEQINEEYALLNRKLSYVSNVISSMSLDSEGTEFDEKLVRTLIERVEVGAHNEFEIKLRFVDEFMELIEELKKEDV